MSADFSQLPDIVWVKVLSFLTLEDRGKIANTCKKINDAFHHPFLWHTVSLRCYGTKNIKTKTLDMSDKYVQMVKQFGKYFKVLDLTYSTSIYVGNDYTDTRTELLKYLGEVSNLECFTLNVQITFGKTPLRAYETPDLSGVIFLLQNSPKLRRLCIVGWPIHRFVRTPDILELIRTHIDLKTLCLFWNGTSSSNWASLNTLMPTSDQFLGLVSALRHLTTLKVRSSMLSSELINELAGHGRVVLKKLDILVTFMNHQGTIHLPDISVSVWSNLLLHSPELAIHFCILNRVPTEDLCNFLKPNLPVLSVEFLKYSRCVEDVINHISDMYDTTLEKFSNFSLETEATDDVVLKLVSKCLKLRYFTFNGQLHHDTAAYIAKLRSDWVVFQVNSANIITTNTMENNNADVLIKKNSDGSADILRSPELLQPDVERQGLLEVMIHEISEALGRPWLPMDIVKKSTDTCETIDT